MYHSRKYQFIDGLLSEVQQHQTSSQIPIITLLMQGNKQNGD
jgi:hypothetical protein